MEPGASCHLVSLLFFPTLTMSFGIGLAIFLVILLLFCSALISGSEVAFFSLTVNDLEKITQDDSKATRRILKLREIPRKLLATILISNNFINIGIVILSEFILRNLLPEDLSQQWATQLTSVLGLSFEVSRMATLIHLLITVVGVTFLLVLFGEVAPKIYAKFNNVNLARNMSGALLFLTRIFRPFSNILVQGTSLIERRLESRTTRQSSKQDIDQAIELTVQGEQHAEHDMDILKGIVKFGDIAVKQIMRSRVDVVAVDFRINFRELMQTVRDAGYSRIPVYDQDFDNITGILYVKDLLGYLDEDDNFEWQELIRANVMYVPEAKKIDDLLKEFQQNRLHMAVVVDEYGGSSGVVTLEDIMEEVIGEIRDEFDDAIELEYKKIDDYNYLFEGKTLLNDVCRVIGVDTDTFDEVKGDADSVAGLLLEMIGFIPKPEDEVNYNDYRFKIVSVDNRRIKQIQITLPKD